MTSAAIVGAFEQELRKELLLAFFVPAVVYMADAVGTQTETLVIRGLALGVPIRAVVARELATGLVIGALARLALLPVRAPRLGRWQGRGSCRDLADDQRSVATVVAMALPYTLARLGRDPAFGSGPLATVIQDLLSILAYFAVAVLLMT